MNQHLLLGLCRRKSEVGRGIIVANSRNGQQQSSRTLAKNLFLLFPHFQT
jgi:hypothetical protein